MKEKGNGNLKNANKLRDLIESSLNNDKALDIVTIELTGKSDMADFMIVASGTSSRHVGAIAEKLMEKLRKAGADCFGAEGYPDCDWVVVDNPYVVVHLFHPESRRHYNLEKMWEASLPELEAAY